METSRAADDLLDVVRVLLLVQAGVLLANTIEALFWGFVFPGAGPSALLCGIAALVIMIARSRLRADRRGPRRLIYVVEGLTVTFFAVDAVLAIALTHALPPLMTVLTQLGVPLAAITVLRRSARAGSPSFASQHLSAPEAA
ncbi:MAG: hypothetical protein M3Z65_06015 [Chloroflexota bacterium]|nr:hypothetical protein [Chloroflexota bacterium]